MLDRWVEHFTLAATAAAVTATPEDERRARAQRLNAARRRAEAAEALTIDGFRADGLRLMAEAYDATLEVCDERLHRAPLEARALPLAALHSLREELARLHLPVLEARFETSHERLYRWLAHTRRRLDAALTDALSTPAQLTRRRRARTILALGLAALAALAALWLALPARRTARLRVTASSEWSVDHRAEKAVDGDPQTEWQAPNRQPGWLDIRVVPPADVGRVRVLNGHNGAYADRACAHLRLHVYRRGALLSTQELRWRQIERAPRWRELRVGQTDVDRIRVEVPAWLGEGAALAEVEWD